MDEWVIVISQQIKNQARQLRSTGLSYNEISLSLGVSETAIRSWASDIALSEEQLKKLRGKGSVNLLFTGGVNGRKTLRRKEIGEEEWANYQDQRKKKKHQNLKANTEKYNKRKIQIQIKGIDYKRNLKKEYIAYKGGKCEKCGYDKDCPTAYHFHHKDPTEKEFCISRSKRYRGEDVHKELDKCQLLCSNCHSEIHDALYIQQKQETLKKLNLLMEELNARLPDWCEG